ncbi:hypothetical protein [Kocuria arenosa]|uniref:hypothetical protein n=1 Tax=Kocuria arenosa TaxID=3071446 RepID=UPI0034D3CE7F
MTTSSAIQKARDDEFESGVRLGSLEWLQALDTPTLRTKMSVAAIATLARGTALVAPLGGFLAPFGGSGADVFSGTDLMSPDHARTVAVICFWIATVGHAWALVDWWRFGRPRDGNGIAAAFLAVAAAAGTLWFYGSSWSQTALLPILEVPIIATGVLGGIALIARLVGSRNCTMRESRLMEMGERLRSLPAGEQQSLLAERRDILEALRGRDLIDADLAKRAAAARLGDWWLLEKEHGTSSED